MGMQDADNLDPLPFQPIDDQMRAAGMNSHRRREFLMFLGQFGEFCEQIADCEQTVGRALCLFNAPSGRSVAPDVRKISFCSGSHERTPRGRTSWQPSSVKMLLYRAEKLGLLD